MPASIRIIAIVKDPYTQSEVYTLEFEVEAEHAKDLMKELTASPYGQRLIDLLNESKFLPEVSPKTTEELKKEADAEEKEREEHEESLRERGRKDMMFKVLAKLRELHGDDFVKAFEDALAGKEEEAITTSNQETSQETSSNNQAITTRTDDDRESE
jgi:hypothetical protein